MATVANLQVVIGANVTQLQKEINEAQKTLKSKFGAKALGISRTSLDILAGVGVAIAGIGAAAVHSAAQMEQTRKAFNTLLKDGQLAKDFLAGLEQFAATTPFELPGLLDSSKKLLAFGFTAQQVIPILTAVGDSAAALGMGEEGINRLTLAIGQMQAKGKVSAEEMLQLAEAGVPAWEMLANSMGVSIPEAMKMAERGTITSAQGIQAIVTGMNSKFGGMMKEQSQTINGMLSNIQDSVGQAMSAIGDDIVDAFDLKSVLKVAQDDIGDFASKVKSMGLGDAIRDTIPPAVGAAISGFAALLLATAIPAMIKLSLAAASVAAGFIGITGPVAIAVAAIGAAAYVIWDNWNWLTVQWEYFCDSMVIALDGAAAEVKNAFAGAVNFAADGLNTLLGIIGLESDLAKKAKEWASETQSVAQAALEAAHAHQAMADAERDRKLTAVKEQATSNFKSADINNLGLKNSVPASIGGIGSALGTEQINREVERINTQIVEAQAKAANLQNDFNNFKLELQFDGLSEFEKVYAGIQRERDERIKAVDDWQAKFTSATAEAQTLYENALKTGNQKAIADSYSMLEAKKQAEIQAATDVAAIKEQIDAETNRKMLSNATARTALENQLEELRRQGDLEGFMALLDEKNAAWLAKEEEKQAIMDAYQQWRMEAEQSYMSFALDAANTLKDGLANAFSNAIVYGKNLGKAIADLGKQIVAMFIQWQVKRMAASVLSKTLQKKETAASIAAATSETAAWTPAAIAYETLHPGSIARATTSVLGAMETGAGAAAGLISSFSGGGINSKDFASGGVVNRTTYARIGEKSYPEAVLPLRSSTLEMLGNMIFSNADNVAGHGGDTTVTVNNYGDINNGADYDSFIADIEYSLAMGMRG